MPLKPHETASEITAEYGEVHLDGPGGLAIAMRPKLRKAPLAAYTRALRKRTASGSPRAAPNNQLGDALSPPCAVPTV